MKSLQRRIIGASMAGAVWTSILGLGGVAIGLRAAIEQRLASPTEWISTDDLARCRTDPEHWYLAAGLIRVSAHHPDGRSDHRHALPLSEEELPGPGETLQLPRRFPMSFWQRRAILRVDETGPCAILQASVDLGSESALGPVGLVRVSSLTGIFLGVIVAFLGTIGFAIRPLLLRIRVLDASATQLGSEGVQLPVDPTEDALGRVARSLARSHERILADRAELHARHTLLERHLAGVAHDLRTPIASVQLTLEALAAERTEDASALGRASMELASLEALADNLLQASRLRGGLDAQADGHDTDLAELCRRLGLRFGILGRARGIRVHAAVPERPVLAGCDPSLAERAVANLLHNAIVHGPTGQAIGLGLDAQGDAFVLTVQSRGPGLDPAQLEAMATRRLTEQDPSRTRQEGLGLGITNEVVDRAGWRIAYRSGNEGGLRVEVRGPCATSE